MRDAEVEVIESPHMYLRYRLCGEVSESAVARLNRHLRELVTTELERLGVRTTYGVAVDVVEPR